MARASLEELRLDYQDFLRQRGLPLWDREDPRRKKLVARRCTTADQVAAWVVESRKGGNGLCGPNGLNGLNGLNGQSTSSTPSTPSTYAELAANAALTLIAVACYLLDRQLAAQAAAFEKEGGFTERLYRTRSQSRRKP